MTVLLARHERVPIQNGELCPTARSHRKYNHRGFSTCLFYPILAVSFLSIIAMETIVRVHQLDLTTSMGPISMKNFMSKGKNVAAVNLDDDRNFSVAGSGCKSRRRWGKQDRATSFELLQSTPRYPMPMKNDYSSGVLEPNRGQVADSQTSYLERYHLRRFAQIDEQEIHYSWVLDPTTYFNLDIKQVVRPRVFYFDPDMECESTPSRRVELSQTALSNNTKAHLDDTRVNDGGASSYDDGCVPASDWQTSFDPTCNDIHALDLTQQMQNQWSGNAELLRTNGYWRNAWKIDSKNATHIGWYNETAVLKTMKFVHNIDVENYEHSCIDALAMERLTSSPHVISAFGACAGSVMTEFADGERVGTLAESKKEIPLARLEIARDIADGLAELHSIGVVHLDVNLANVVSIRGRLKLNDFNIALVLKRNQTNGNVCSFPAESQYSNPQWRSPEEANGNQRLTEKVDVFSLGHIFFRLICRHEPWHKLEPGYKRGETIRTDNVNEQVKRGVLPHIPEKVLHTGDAEVAMIREAMLMCYTYDPEKRPSARSIASFLDQGLAVLSKHAHLRKPGKHRYGSFQLV